MQYIHIEANERILEADIKWNHYRDVNLSLGLMGFNDDYDKILLWGVT